MGESATQAHNGKPYISPKNVPSSQAPSVLSREEKAGAAAASVERTGEPSRVASWIAGMLGVGENPSVGLRGGDDEMSPYGVARPTTASSITPASTSSSDALLRSATGVRLLGGKVRQHLNAPRIGWSVSRADEGQKGANSKPP